MIRTITLAAAMALAAPAAAAEYINANDAYTMIGYAKAATKHCKKLKINPDGVLKIADRLSALDQAKFGVNKTLIDMRADDAGEHFKALGEKACAAALAYEKKLGIDIFAEK